MELPDANWRRTFRRRLLAWYASAKRDLPWRRTRNIYHTWVSEIMLQQTQVASVEPYFERFVAAFPTIAVLAEADEQQVLRQWEGLGYYRRARHLHRAAREIVDRHSGRFPRDTAVVQTLPGIGRYTAGAILSIASDAREPILEANTTRLAARLLAFRGDPASRRGSEFLWSFAGEILPRKNCGQFNQALMELGSLVCTPRSPDCSGCPVRALCRAATAGLQDKIPRKIGRPKIEEIRQAAVVVRCGGRVLLRQCAAEERWAGMWDFPRFDVTSRHAAAVRRELASKVRALTKVAIEPGRHLTTIKHGVTRFRITLECYEATRSNNGRAETRRPNQKWLRPAELEQYPLSVTARKLSRLLS